MDLGTAPLFDLTAPVADEVVDAAVPVSRSEELLAEIRDDENTIAEHEISKIRRIAEWAGHHVVDDEADASTLTERGLDTGLPLAGPGAPLISDFAVMELSALLGRRPFLAWMASNIRGQMAWALGDPDEGQRAFERALTLPYAQNTDYHRETADGMAPPLPCGLSS